MINWIMGFFVPSVDKAIGGLSKASKKLEIASSYHANKAYVKKAKSFNLAVSATAHEDESKRAMAVSTKIKALIDA